MEQPSEKFELLAETRPTEWALFAIYMLRVTKRIVLLAKTLKEAVGICNVFLCNISYA